MKKNHAPVVLLVDDNRNLLYFLSRLIAEAGWVVLKAESAAAARKIVVRHKPDAALLDYMLPDGDAVELGMQLRQIIPRIPVVVMSGSVLPPEDQAICEEQGFPVLRKPFLASDVMNQIRKQLRLRTLKVGTSKRLKRKGVGTSSRALKVFFAYSHCDEKMRDRLDAHLSTLKRMWLIDTWHDRKITAGDDIDDKIDCYLGTADLILLLVSPDFLSSDYCYKREMRRALARHRKGDARVIPVILRPVDWDKTPFARLLAVPKDGKPITRFTNRDAGYLDAAKAIRKAAEELSAKVRPERG